MITQVLHCPYCQGIDIVRHGQSPEVKEHIIEMAMNPGGVRDTARVLHISPTTVIKALKKSTCAPTGE